MKINHYYSTPDRPVADQIPWKLIDTRITEPNGNVVFEMSGVEVPSQWSQRAANVLAQKYLRKAGVPSETYNYSSENNKLNEIEFSMPVWLRPSKPTTNSVIGGETSARQVFHRMCGAWAYWGWRSGHFTNEEDAKAFYDEIYMMLALQIAAPNSPQWFNTGLFWAYGIAGPDSGQWICDDGTPQRVYNSYERPQVHACFLTPLNDDLVNEGGIFDRLSVEARIFKHGSGSGINVSRLRSPTEKLSGGGVASGAMSFLRVFDAGAGATKSGGVTRRAAKMVIMEMDHPEIEQFINWKVREEAKAAAMYVGSQVVRDAYLGNASYNDPMIDYPLAVKDRAEAGFEPEILSVDWEGEAIRTIDGQNSNNSVRPTDEFMLAAAADTKWSLTSRTTGEIVKSMNARDLWSSICRAAWACGDPGVIYHDTVNAWNTCAADGTIRTANPCSEYNFLDGTACNLASLKLTAFLRGDGVPLDMDAFEHACRLWTIVLDISVSMASYPAKEFALGAYNYRTLGLGYADLGGLLARLDLRYDSDNGRALASSLTALMSGVSYYTSGEMAAALGPFSRWEANRKPMLAVMNKHRDAASSVPMPDELGARAQEVWRHAEFLGMQHGFRNAQTTLIAPTGTISIVMDCETSGIEPFFAPSVVKSLAGGGEFTYEYEVKSEDCAMNLDPFAHVRMVAAVQPFLSGAASKTFNMPHSATPEDVDRVFRAAHSMGVKAIAIYRDGSKLSQPLNVVKSESENELKRDVATIDRTSLASNSHYSHSKDNAVLKREDRERLPASRRGTTQTFRVAGQRAYLRTGEYSDGRLGELFLDLAGAGSTLDGFANCLAKMTSIALQYGVPASEVVDALLGIKFEPAGFVEEHDRIKVCSSIPDLIARHIGIEYLGREELAHTLRAVSTAGEIVALDKRAVSIAAGYSGEVCSSCHNATLRRAGSCAVCETCGATTGCG